MHVECEEKDESHLVSSACRCRQICGWMFINLWTNNLVELTLSHLIKEKKTHLQLSHLIFSESQAQKREIEASSLIKVTRQWLEIHWVEKEKIVSFSHQWRNRSTRRSIIEQSKKKQTEIKRKRSTLQKKGEFSSIFKRFHWHFNIQFAKTFVIVVRFVLQIKYKNKTEKFFSSST